MERSKGVKMGMRFENLQVWQKSMQLVKMIYLLTNTFPKSKIYSLTSQIKRSAISVPINIAEGKGRGSIKEFINFLHISLGSLYELQTQLYLAKDLNSISNLSLYNDISMTISQLDKMINSLINNRKNMKGGN